MMAYKAVNLSLETLQTLPGFVTKSGQEWRLACPIHGGTNPTAFSVCLLTGKFHCFACGAKGVLVEWQLGQPTKLPVNTELANPTWQKRPKIAKKSQEKPTFLSYNLGLAQKKLAHATGYLNSRGISYATAKKFGLGFDPKWRFVTARPRYGFKELPAILFPTSGSTGLLNLYARAISCERLHYIPPGESGLFNFGALEKATAAQSVILVEGAFDALSYIEAGYENVTALIGVNLKDLSWYKKARRIILAFDSDDEGQNAEQRAAQQLKQAGHTPEKLPRDFWAGHKDFNEFWMVKGRNLEIHWQIVLERTILI